MKTKQIATNS